MAKVVQVRRGTTAALSSVTGAEGELFVDTDKETLTVHNNYQAGGFPLLREDLNNLGNNTIDISKLQYGSAIAGQAIKVNNAANALEYGAVGFRSVQAFVTAGTHTYTKPAGINTIKVTVTGGGGGGYGVNNDNDQHGASGGAGPRKVALESPDWITPFLL